MNPVLLLAGVTIAYAGYNLMIKVSGTHVPATATTTVLATIALQLAALATSLVFLTALALRGGQSFALTPNAYLWAALAGLCIGAAEIGYLYLFGGIGAAKPMAASIAIPTIVSGTIVIATLASALLLDEPFGWHQVAGGGLILAGILVFFRGG